MVSDASTDPSSEPLPSAARYRWRVRDCGICHWRELPGLHTSWDIWKLLKHGQIAGAERLDDIAAAARQVGRLRG